MTDIIDMDSKRKSKKAKNSAEVLPLTPTEVATLLLQCFEGEFVPTSLKKFPHNIWVFNSRAQKLWLYVNPSNECSIVSNEWVADALCDFSNTLSEPQLHLMVKKAKEVLDFIRARTKKIVEQLPPSISSVESQEISFFKVPVIPKEIHDLSQAPMMSEFAARMSNFDAFAMTVARICIPELGLYRKQSLWIHGEANSGKTTLANALGEFLGYGQVNGTNSAYMACQTEDFQSRFFLSQTIGKRVLCVDEPKPGFIRSDRFKSITGNSLHAVEMKGKDSFQAKLDFTLIFTSNDEPPVRNDEAFITRLVYCRLDDLPEESRVPNASEFLCKEMPYVVSYGRYLLELKGIQPFEPIPHNSDELRDIAKEDDHDAHSIFSRYFQLDPKSITPRRVIDAILKDDVGVNGKKERKDIMQSFVRLHSLEKTQQRFGNEILRCIKGLKPMHDKIGGHRHEPIEALYCSEIDPEIPF